MEQIKTLNQYAAAAETTRLDSTCGDCAIIYPALGLAGEAGEVADKVKKLIRDHGGVTNINDDQKNAIALELGDVLWYISAMADDLGLGLELIANMNIGKLRSRQQRKKLNGDGDYR